MYGHTDIYDEQCSGQPSVSAETIAKVEQEMSEDRHVTVCELCKRIPEVSKSTIDKILTKHLHYRKVYARWVPKMITEVHKRQHVETAHRFLEHYAEQGEKFLDSIVIGDKAWVHFMTPETKEKFCQWQHSNLPKPRKFKQTLSAGKMMASVFGDRKGVLLCEFMPISTTINTARYCET